MSTFTLRIIAQLFENYSDTDTPYWKPKGGLEYTAQVSDSMRMWASNDDIKELAIELLAAESNNHERVEYIEHDFAHDPIEVTDKFKALFNKKFQTEVA